MEDYEDSFEEDCEDSFVEAPKVIQDRITETQYSRGELLGSGYSGNCYLFTDLETKRKYAGKIMIKMIKNRLNYKLDKINEITSIQMSLRHPNILRMFRYFDCSTYVCTTMELCDSTLKSVLERLGVLDEQSCRYVVREVACGISYLHENRVIHRGIEPNNIFFTKDMDVKIGDFELAIKHEDPVKKISDSYGKITYLAPESIDGSGYSFGVDVWALGVTLYKMVVGHVPFDYMTCYKQLDKKVKSCDYHIPSTVPTNTEDMIKSLLTRDPDNRPAIDDILKLEYLSSESISKHHLRGYILGEPSTNINNQENSNEYNAMPLSRNKSIPKEDCKLNLKSGIEDIFHKGFRLVSRCSSFEEQLSMAPQYDSSHEDENIPGKEFNLDIEKESKFILEELDKSLGAFFCCGQGIISSSEMDSYALTRFRRPKYFITRWVDFNEKYDLGYQLSDSSVGVIFKDNSCLVTDGAMKNFQYVDKNGA
uniref:Polo kinase n=1 Tax=Strongyloides papillosus TaxID=174720 RepID=A0A0N5BJI9_STREA